MISLNDLVALLGLLGAGIAVIAATARWLLGKIDRTDTRLAGRIDDVDKLSGTRTARIHDRLDKAYGEFAPREDMNRHVERIEAAVNGIDAKIDTNAADVTRRLEAIQRDLVGHLLNGRRRDTEG